jgi:hypothetical protein
VKQTDNKPNGNPPGLNGLPDDPDTPIEVTIVEPTAEQVEEGLANLNACLPYWKTTPALLVIKPDLGLIVSVLDATHDRMGFSLRLAVHEKLEAPSDFDESEMKVSCVWNQPYMSFGKSVIWAPYCFSINFGSEGVARARELREQIRAEISYTPDTAEIIVCILRGSFPPEPLDFG